MPKDPPKTSRTAIFILGMHRSGTSALARVVNLLGAELPGELEPANEYNAAGYWESRDLIQFHDRLLQAAGSGWNDWRAISPEWLQSSVAQGFADEARDALGRVFQDAPLFVFKDPRVCRFLPFWLSVLEQQAIEPIALVPVRNPLDVAASLQRRDQFSRAKSMLLWMRHVLDAELASRGIPRLFTTYDQLLGDWRGLETRVRNRFGWLFPPLSGESERAIDAFLSDRHRHHSSSEAPDDRDSDILEGVAEAYRVLIELAEREDEPVALLQRLQDLRRGFDSTTHVFSAAFYDERQHLLKCQQNLLDQANRQRQADRDRFTKEVAWLQGDAERRIEELRRDMQRRVDAQTQKTVKANEQIRRLQVQSDRRRRNNVTLQAELSGLLHHANAIQTSAAWRAAKPLYWVERRRPTLVGKALALPRLAWWTASLKLPHRLAERRQVIAVLRSGLFDEAWYMARYPEVVSNGAEPVVHWVTLGWREGRSPHPLFDVPWYLERHPEAASSSLDPLSHYLAHGSEEGHDPGPLFDTAYYLKQCPQAADSPLVPLLHYLREGALQGCSPCPLFDHDWYMERSPDLAPGGMNPLLHYLQFGAEAGRDPNADFDSSWYLLEYPHVAESGVNPLVHFLTHGMDEGYQPAGDDDSERSDYEGGAVDADTARLMRLVPAWNGDWEALVPGAPGAANGVLVVDWKPPTPDCDSGSYRMDKILECLAASGRPLYFIGDQDAHAPAYLQRVHDKGIITAIGRPEAAKLLKSHGASLGTVILSRPTIAERYLPLVRAMAVHARVIYDTVDLHWVRFERGAEVSEYSAEFSAQAARYKPLELAIAASCDETIAITADERAILQAELPEAVIRVLPNIHDTVAEVPPFEQRSGLFFIGSFQHQPNGEAVEYLVNEILPRLIPEMPDIRLTIVGSDMPDAIKQMASDHVLPLGFVPDVAPHFASSRLFVAPLLHGAGMKGKIGQALGHGLPVVTTAIGAEGIGLTDGKDVLLADDPDQFVEQIKRAYHDPALWSALSGAGLAHIERNFTIGTVRQRVYELIGESSSG